MKKPIIWWAMLTLVLLTFQCSTDDNVVTSPVSGPETQGRLLDPELNDYLICQGFDLTDAKLFNDHVVLEGDLVIRLDEIHATIDKSKRDGSSGRTEQFVVNTGAVVTFANVLGINYFIDPGVGPIDGDWEAAIRTATQNWEDLPYSRVDFTEVFSAVGAELIFYADNSLTLPSCARNLAASTYAMAEFPGAGQPGRWISINDSDVSATQPNRETVIRHELGHALGFRHDNPIVNGEPVNATGGSTCGNDVLGANNLVGTPASDGASIMVSTIGTSTSIALSTNDAKAATFLYPAGYATPVISSINQYYKTASTRDVNVNMSAPTVRMYRYRVERLPPWSSTPVQTNEYVGTSNTFWLLDVPLGTWNFRITSFNYATDANMPGATTQLTIQ